MAGPRREPPSLDSFLAHLHFNRNFHTGNSVYHVDGQGKLHRNGELVQSHAQHTVTHIIPVSPRSSVRELFAKRLPPEDLLTASRHQSVPMEGGGKSQLVFVFDHGRKLGITSPLDRIEPRG